MAAQTPAAPLNWCEIEAIVSELGFLKNCAIQKIWQVKESHFAFQIHTPGQTYFLHIDLQTPIPCVFIHTDKPSKQPINALGSLLRKTLCGKRLIEASPIKGERIVKLVFAHREEVSMLYISLFPKSPTLYLTDGKSKIIHTSPSLQEEMTHFEPTANPDIKPFPLRQIELDKMTSLEIRHPFSSYLHRLSQLKKRQKISNLVREITKQQKKLIRLEKNLLVDVNKGKQHQTLQKEGDLLSSYLHTVKAKSTGIILEDYTQDPPANIEIKLDPAKSPAENLSNKYQQAKRLKRKLKVAREQLESLSSKRVKLDELQTLLDENASNELDISHQQRFIKMLNLPEDYFTNDSSSPSKRKKDSAGRQPYLCYSHHPLFQIWVARSAKDAEQMLKIANSNDWWFHVVEGTGAHVILRGEKKKSPPQEIQIDACLLAIHHSSQKNNSKIEVYQSLRQHLIKKKGMAAGKFHIRKSEVLLINNNPYRIAEILKSRKTIKGLC